MQLQQIQSNIHDLRGHKVMLDYTLAELYEVETRVLNQAVKRNIKRFPPDFMFQLSKEEWETMSSQIVMTSAINFLLRKEKQQTLQQKRKKIGYKK